MHSVSKIALVAVGALAAVAGAQEDINQFPGCSQWCIRNMQLGNKTQELGCNAGDNGCLCRNPNFAYGVRDCSGQLCGDNATGEQALGYVVNFCKDAGVALATVLPAGAVNATGGAGGAVGSAVPVSTVQFTSTITTDGSTITTTAASTVFSTPSAVASGASSASQKVSTIVSDGSTFVSTLTSELGSLTSSIASEATKTADNTDASTAQNSASATSTSAQGFAAQMTAAPAGILAVAGVAAFLL